MSDTVPLSAENRALFVASLTAKAIERNEDEVPCNMKRAGGCEEASEEKVFEGIFEESSDSLKLEDAGKVISVVSAL